MSFLKIGDRAAGAIKSGGTTRRAAKMVVVDIDHPDIEEFIDWKVREEQKVAALVAGSRLARQHLDAVLRACREPMHGDAEAPFDPKRNPALRRAIRKARAAMVPESSIQRMIELARQGREDCAFPEFDIDWDSEAYRTVSGQNANNSVRVTNAFHGKGDAGRRLGADPPHRRRDRPAPAGPRAVGADRRGRLGLRRSRPAVRHHDQRVAHLPRRAGASTRPTRARSTCSSTTRPAISPRSTC